MVYSNGPTLYSESKIWVDYIPSGGGTQARFDGFGLLFDEEPIPGDPYQGTSATGLVTVELAPGHTELTKPLIVVEGFDPEDDFVYEDFINDATNGGIDVPIDPATGTTLNEAIENEDYDLVFVDFANSTTHIQRNAYMVEAVIEWVNGLKQTAGSTEQNVVLGMSMGGLVARYALRHMEIDNDPTTNHDTKLYISHDVPHQGANVPLAYQAMVRHLYGETISIPILFSLIDFELISLNSLVDDLDNGYDLLQSPAAKQMLTYQLQGNGDSVSINNNSLHDSFLAEIANMGYPSQGGIRNIAIANCSECDDALGFNVYDTLVNVDETIDLPFFITNLGLAFLNLAGWNPLKTISSLLSTNTDIKAQFNLKALPNQEYKRIYKGKIFIKKKILGFITVREDLINEESLYSSSSMLPLDNASGGIYDIETFIDLPSDFDDFLVEREFNFIPTYSSLDIDGGLQAIGLGDLNKTYSPLAPPLSPKNVPFDNFFTNDLTSEQHIQFTLNSGNWLIEELDNDVDRGFYSCASICPEDLPLEIVGSDFICNSSSETYHINNIRQGVTINWSLSQTGGLSLSQNGSSVTITALGNFSVETILTASIETDCNNVEITKTIGAGNASVSTITFNNDFNDPGYWCSSHYNNTYSISTNPDNVSTHQIRLKKYPNLNTIYAPSTNYTGTSGTMNFTPTPGFYLFEVRFNNSCGWSSWYGHEVEFIDCTQGGGGSSGEDRFAVYPNPSSKQFTVQKKLSETKTGKSPNENNTTNFTLYDFSGNLILKGTLTDRISINVSSLKKGKYILSLHQGENEETHLVLIE
ncbi:T9SS type A sorting domain-containing protein [Winogradskyella ursingii]|uniref:T9SS type A sorting domain-containing protein n=1 Tax=Winogradskyella ursingii TaxID=2686079 RepID=UPI0015CD4C04|nr:T9SS type A sorting domain-containing protein [Winogradskyella ursingii]